MNAYYNKNRYMKVTRYSLIIEQSQNFLAFPTPSKTVNHEDCIKSFRSLINKPSNVSTLLNAT